jgi:hypothetical protein
MECIAEQDVLKEEDGPYNCEWCSNGPDEQGFQKWYSGRKNAKKRHLNDRPKSRGVGYAEDLPPRYSAPKDLDGRVKEIKEISRRKAVKRRKLEEAAQSLVDAGGHHLADMEGMNGLDGRPVTDELVDELIQNGNIDPEEWSED